MKYVVVFAKDARKELDRLPKLHFKRIAKKIDDLESDPAHPAV